MLWDYFEPVTRVTRTKVSDGFGGVKVTWTDGESLRAGISMNSAPEYQIAMQKGLQRSFTVVTAADVILRQGDYLRTRYGLLRIVTNNADMQTPAVATLAYRQCVAEGVSA